MERSAICAAKVECLTESNTLKKSKALGAHISVKDE